MDILKLIKKDHGNVKTLFKRLERRAEQGGDETEALVNELVTEILLHAKSEEKALYRHCRQRTEKLREFALEGHVEHKLLEIAVKRLSVVPPGPDGKFKAVLSVAKELFVHHAEEEEEKEIFPKILKAFSAEEREELGARMQAIKDDLRLKQNGITELETPEASPDLVRAEATNGDDNPTVTDLPGSAPYAGDEAMPAEDIEIHGERETGKRQGGAAIGPEGVIQAIRPESPNSPGAAGAIPSHHPELVPSAVVPAPSAGAADEELAPGEAPRSEQLKRAV